VFGRGACRWLFNPYFGGGYPWATYGYPGFGRGTGYVGAPAYGPLLGHGGVSPSGYPAWYRGGGYGYNPPYGYFW